MFELKAIIQQLDATDYRNLVEKMKNDPDCSDCVYVMQAYRSGEFTPEDLQSQLLCDPNSFKIIERSIYVRIIEYLELETCDLRDTVLIQVFYALYGHDSGNRKKETEYLELLFSNLKREKIDYLSAPLLEMLKKKCENSELYPVYHHMYRLYFNVDQANQRAFSLLTQFNRKLGVYAEQAEDSVLKEMIATFKELRAIERQYPNLISKAIKDITLLSLVVFADQTQLLLEDQLDMDQLCKTFEEDLSELPKDMAYFYLRNTFYFISFEYHLSQNNLKAADIINSYINSLKGACRGYNFEFPIQLYHQSVAKLAIETEITLGKHNEKKKRLFPTEVIAPIFNAKLDSVFQRLNRPSHHHLN